MGMQFLEKIFSSEIQRTKEAEESSTLGLIQISNLSLSLFQKEKPLPFPPCLSHFSHQSLSITPGKEEEKKKKRVYLSLSL